MKFAIIKTGASQSRVEEGRLIEVDLLHKDVGQTVEYEALLVVDDDSVTIGTPTVANAKVTATVVEHFRGPKIRVFKYKPKKRYRKTRGHRQTYTRLMIDQISTSQESNNGT